MLQLFLQACQPSAGGLDFLRPRPCLEEPQNRLGLGQLFLAAGDLGFGFQRPLGLEGPLDRLGFGQVRLADTILSLFLEDLLLSNGPAADERLGPAVGVTGHLHLSAAGGNLLFVLVQVALEGQMVTPQIPLRQVAPPSGAFHPLPLLGDFFGSRPDLQEPQPGTGFVQLGPFLRQPALQARVCRAGPRRRPRARPGRPRRS